MQKLSNIFPVGENFDATFLLGFLNNFSLK